MENNSFENEFENEFDLKIILNLFNKLVLVCICCYYVSLGAFFTCNILFLNIGLQTTILVKDEQKEGGLF
jgi:hypothetical protein